MLRPGPIVDRSRFDIAQNGRPRRGLLRLSSAGAFSIGVSYPI